MNQSKVIIHLNYNNALETLFLLISFKFSQNRMVAQNC